MPIDEIVEIVEIFAANHPGVMLYIVVKDKNGEEETRRMKEANDLYREMKQDPDNLHPALLNWRANWINRGGGEPPF